MIDNTNWTPYPDDNKLGITDKELINEYEAIGITKAEIFVLNLDVDEVITMQLILKIHRIAFEYLYDWAGKWRNVQVKVGRLIPPDPNQVINLMTYYVDNLNFKILESHGKEDHLSTMVYSHYEFIRIHPFNNGNGRLGRIILNIIALKFGYKPLQLYHRDGDARQDYIQAMKYADNGNFDYLRKLISKELEEF